MFDMDVLISEVQKRPLLYNGVTLGNREARLKQWKEIAEILHENWHNLETKDQDYFVREVQTKWRTLRDSFTRTLRLAKLEEATGKRFAKRRFQYYSKLAFLKPYCLTRSTTTYEDEEDTLDVSNNEFYLTVNPLEDAEMLATEEKTPMHSAADEQVSIFSSHNNYDKMENRLDRYERRLDNSVDEERRSDPKGNRMFLLSLLPFMDQFPDSVNMEVRMKIMNVVHSYIVKRESDT